MLTNLRTKLTSSHIIVALAGILLTSLLANLLLENQFRQYIKANLRRQNQRIIAQIAQNYNTTISGWNPNDLTEIGMNALSQGLILKLKGTDGAIIWDATVHNNGLCRQMILHMADNMLSRYPNWRGGYVENVYPVVKNSRTVGTVNIGFYGPFYFQDTDLAFINTLNRILLGVTVLAIFLALFIGSFMAKRLSTPIAKVIQTTREIAGGNLDARSDSRTSIMEVNQLIEAVNNLALSLKQQESLRKRLTGDMAHELRTPLATLQSHLEAMLDGIWKPDSKRLKVCHDEIMRVNRMVKDLERLAKYESDNSSLVKTRFDPAELIQQLLLNYEPEFRNKGVKLKFTADHLRIMADRDKLSQAIINLLSNALKFTPSGGEVAIRLEAGPETITIAVKDNGCGIAPEDLPYIFERFYRADKSRNRQTGGSGIGLTITKAIVEAHRGTIRVTSRVGEGTEFQILLPVG